MESLHRRKYSNTSNGFSFSSKNPYDGVLVGPNKIGAPNNKYRVEDYGEIFSSGSRGSSIPILEVPELDDDETVDFRRSSKVDYEKIFGGFRDEVVAVSHEELFSRAKFEINPSVKARSPSETESPLQGSDHLNCSEQNNQMLSTEASDQSFDRVKLFNMSYHKTSQRRKDGTNGTTHVAQLHAVPGFTHFIDETTTLRKTESEKPVPRVKSDVSNRNFDKAFEEKHGSKTISDIPIKQTSQGVVKAKNGSNWDRSYSNDKLFNAFEINAKSLPSKVAHASTPPSNSHDNRGHFKRSIDSNFTPKNGASEGATGDCSPSFSDEEIDVNSVAAVSAAALKKAIEKAQESIRIAKEIMERKKEGLQTYSKPNSKGSLKVKDRREKIIPHEANRIKEENTEEPCERVEAVSQVFAGMEKKTSVKSHVFAPDYKENEKHLINRNRKVVGQESEEKPESAEEREPTTLGSDLASAGKSRTASSAFEQGDGKSTILKSKYKDECKLEAKAAKETREHHGDIFKKLKEVEETSHWEGMEKRHSADKVEQKWDLNVDKFEFYPIVQEQEKKIKSKITQGDKETKEKQKDVWEQKECQNKFKFESQTLMENDYSERLNKSQELVKNVKKQGTPEQEQIELRVENAHEREGNEIRHRKISDDEEIEMRPKEVCQAVENGNMLEEASGGESNDMKHRDGLKSEASEKRLDEVHQLKIDEDRPTDAHGGEESEKTLEEEYEWERNNTRPTGGFIYVEAEKTQKENDRSKENAKVEVTQNAICKMNFDSGCAADKHIASKNTCESRESCIDEVNNNAKKREEVIAHEENGRMPGGTDTFCEFKEVEKEADLVKVPNKLNMNKTEVFETTSLFHSAAEGNEIKNKMKDASEALPSDHNVPEMVEVAQNVVYETTFDSVCDAGKWHARDNILESQEACRDEVNNNYVETREKVNECEENGKLLGDTEAFCEFKDVGKESEVAKVAYKPKKQDLFETVDLIQAATEENEIQDNLKDVTVDLPFDDSAPNLVLNAMNFGQECVEQKDQEFELVSSLENKAEVLIQESGGNEEIFEECEIAYDEEEQENNDKAAHEGREWVQNGEKLEASQLPGVADGKEKTMEIHEDIKPSRNMEKEGRQWVQNREKLEAYQLPGVAGGKEKATETTEEIQTSQNMESEENFEYGENEEIFEECEIADDEEEQKNNDKVACEGREWVQNGENLKASKLPGLAEGKEKTMEIHEEIKPSRHMEKEGRQWVQNGEKLEASQLPVVAEGKEKTMEIHEEIKPRRNMEKEGRKWVVPNGEKLEAYQLHGVAEGKEKAAETTEEIQTSQNMESEKNFASGGNEEFFEECEIADDEEEQKNNDKVAREGREWVQNGEKLEASKLPGVAEGKEKTMEIHEEIKPSPHMEKEGRQWVQNGEKLEASQLPVVAEGKEKTMEIHEEIKPSRNMEKEGRKWVVPNGEKLEAYQLPGVAEGKEKAAETIEEIQTSQNMVSEENFASGGNEEFFEECEIADDEEEQKNNDKVAREGREWVQNGEKLEASKLPGVAEGKEKTMEIHEEIKPSPHMEKEGSPWVQNGEKLEASQLPVVAKGKEKTMEIHEEIKPSQHMEKEGIQWVQNGEKLEASQLPGVAEGKEKAAETTEEIQTSQNMESEENFASGGNEEIFEECEIADDEKEQENNDKAAREGREWVQNGEKLEASKLPGAAEGKAKTMEIHEEIKPSPNMEKEGIRWVQNEEKLEASQLPGVSEGKQKATETTEEIQTSPNMDSEENFDAHFVMREKETNATEQKEVAEKEHVRTIDETNKRERAERDKTLRRHWEKDRRAVERAIRGAQLPSESEWKEKTMEIDEEIKISQTTVKEESVSNSSVMENKESKETVQNEVEEKDVGEIDDANKKERTEGEKTQRRHWEKDRVAVERAIREARERAFAEAREKAERAAVERATAEVRQRVMAEAREKIEKASTAARSAADKTSVEAKLRAERAAVERATVEARERALEKALSQKATSEARLQPERLATEKFSGASRDNGMKQSFSSADSQRFDGTNNESVQRCKARLERHQRIMERAANALAEKNMRDVLAQKEQAERNRLAEALDADVKRWSSGKERNLRALLSTLQYILGPDSGWQPISLTDLITTNAVKKAYRKATLYVHPDKLQQKGASIQQKYICEKVFDLLKAAWSRFNSEER